MKALHKTLLLTGVGLALCHCGAGATTTLTSDIVASGLDGGAATGEESGTTGTTIVGSGADYSNLSTSMTNVASSLVPSISTTVTATSTAKAIPGTAAGWELLNEDHNIVMLTDIFGPTGSNAPITRIRVAIDTFKGSLEHILRLDPELDCITGSPSVRILSDADTVDIPFFGPLRNGPAEDRHLDCHLASGSDTTMLYGIDSDGLLHVVTIDDSESVNTEVVTKRGNSVRGMRVFQATFDRGAVDTESGLSLSHLDFQYTQATLYSGVDDIHGTADDVVFKSRTRITGAATVDSTGAVLESTGDFQVTKYDEGVNDDGSPWKIVNQTKGRGSYGDGEHALFAVQSDQSNIEADALTTYCLQSVADALPIHAEADNCALLETALPWDSVTMPLPVDPAIEDAFDDKPFYAGNDTDLIANDGSNYITVAYATEDASSLAASDESTDESPTDATDDSTDGDETAPADVETLSKDDAEGDHA